MLADAFRSGQALIAVVLILGLVLVLATSKRKHR